MKKYFFLLLLLLFIPLVEGAETCQSLGNPTNCIEVWPDQSGTKYTYYPDYDIYLMDDTSDDDYYFLLMGDVSCDKSCFVFEFATRRDQPYTTTFDLNDYTVTYTDGAYDTLTNNGFEEWTGNNPIGWDVISGSVEPRDTQYWMPMDGDWVLYTDGASVIESSYMNLPIQDRTYMAYVTVGRAATSDITLEVINSAGEVECSVIKPGFFRGQSFGCEFMPSTAGQYKIRLTTEGYAYFDRTGIVPYSDYAVVIGSNYNLGRQIGINYPGLSLPGTWDSANLGDFSHLICSLVVKNGNIRIGSENLNSYAVRTTSGSKGFVEDLDVRVRGMQSRTISVGGGIKNSYLEVDMPWYFARENSVEENIIAWGGVVTNNTLIGGQGVIRLKGTGTEISNNFIRNDAQATNHYAIIHSGAVDPIIKNNIFDPIEGSGILSYVGAGYKIYNNTFYVRTATCNVEYVNEDYSTNGIRMNDYNSGKNHDNEVINNTFYIEGRDFNTAWSNCMPVTTGIFYSASGVNNKIWNNKYYVTKTDPGDDNPVFAFYIGGYAFNMPEDNRLFVNNYIETNDKALWINTFYGSSSNQWLENNTFVRTPNNYYTPSMPESAIRLGYYRATAPNMHFINNHFEGGFDEDAYFFTANNDASLYDISKQWYVNIVVTDGGGTPLEGAVVTGSSTSSIHDEVIGMTDNDGFVRLVLSEYLEEGDMRPNGPHLRTSMNPHNIYVQYEDTLQDFGNFEILQETDLTLTMALGGSCPVNGETRSCGIDTGACQQGTQTCINGNWGPCVGSINPSTEVCNGIDDDCNGMTDEYLGTTTCGLGACVHTIDNCVAGIIQTCNPMEGSVPETNLILCGNGIDDDCNGEDIACGHVITSSETSTELICDIQNPLGIKDVQLMTDSGSGYQVVNSVSNNNNDYYFLETENFDYEVADWDVCPNSVAIIEGNNCEDDRVTGTNFASGLAHSVADNGINSSGVTDMELINTNLFGNFNVWARSYQRGGSASLRTWAVASDTQQSQDLGGLSTGKYEWQDVGSMQFDGRVLARDTYPDGYWTYPDLILLTDDDSFNPSITCGEDASLLQPRKYSLGTCGVVPTQYEARFTKPAGTYEWTCSYTDGTGARISSDDCIGCNQGDICTTNEECDDGNSCTLDACTNFACENIPLADNTPCDDGIMCTENNLCTAGFCTAGTSNPDLCPDNPLCTIKLCTVNGCEYDGCEEISGLITHIPFDNDYLDKSVPPKPLSCTNCPTPASGRLSGAYDFDGINDELIMESFDIVGNAMTISAWIDTDDLSACGPRIVSKATSTAEGDHLWMLGTCFDEIRFRLSTDGGGEITLKSGPGTLTETEGWVHVAAVYDGTEMRLYKNGNPVGSLSPKTGDVLTDNSLVVRVGNNAGSVVSSHFNGKIDDLRIYNNAIAETDIPLLMQELNTPNIEGYDFNNDGLVNIFDIVIFTNYFGFISGDSGYDSDADFNNDGRINIIDLVTMASNYN